MVLLAPDVEWHLSFDLPDLPPDKRVFRGHAEVSELWAAFRAGWEELSLTLEEVLEAREDHVIFRARFVGRGAGSGIEVDRSIFYVNEVADGVTVRLRPFSSEQEARAAANAG